MTRRILLLGGAAACAAILAACGGDDNGASRGALGKSATDSVVTTLSAAQIDAVTAASGLQALSGKAKCDVKMVALNYHTVGVQGESSLPGSGDVNASGVLLLPAGGCAGTPASLVAYAKGTDVQKPRTLADPQDSETMLLVAMYAAQGYAVVATDYLGFAKSSYPYHPYLHAESEASSVIDSVRAARIAAAALSAPLSGKVMLTGYSQGGHSSMSAQRAAERDAAAEINVVAGAHLAGPYNLSGSFKTADLNNPIAGYQFFVPFIVTAWQKVYGNLYTSPSQVFNAPYDGYVETLLPSPTLNYTTLLTTGKLPAGTPKQAQDALFKLSYLTDVKTNDTNALYVDAKKNDLLGWTPKAKVLLCGGAGDPTVSPFVHQNVMKADFDARGVTNVTSVDVDAAVQATYGVNGKAPTDPTSAAFATYYGNYHGTYEPPFCHAQARAFFDTVK